MTYSPQPQRPALLPRSADAQFYAQWAVRRIGAAFAVAIIGPFAIGLPAVLALGELGAIIATIAAIVLPLGAILSLCFATAP